MLPSRLAPGDGENSPWNKHLLDAGGLHVGSVQRPRLWLGDRRDSQEGAGGCTPLHLHKAGHCQLLGLWGVSTEPILAWGSGLGSSRVQPCCGSWGGSAPPKIGTGTMRRCQWCCQVLAPCTVPARVGVVPQAARTGLQRGRGWWCQAGSSRCWGFRACLGKPCLEQLCLCGGPREGAAGLGGRSSVGAACWVWRGFCYLGFGLPALC